ncbi:MAG: hypothetical protein FWF34_01690 [Alphaproteobacteria bacterium]|nr:hypothetical protein [Alphaproteobacteria bacterium]MCL2889950.1 hypothetical protein [Alphaproteobacteria bacterium]
MSLKNIFKKIAFAGIGLVVGIGAAHAAQPIVTADICLLIGQLQEVFKLLRTLAFIGAAFMILGWAWGIITGKGEGLMDDLKKKGLALLVGFTLLFSVGLIIQFVVLNQSVTGCVTQGW